MSNFIIREPRLSDTPAIRPMLERWVTDRDTGAVLTDEIAADIAKIEASINDNSPPRLLVAEEAGRVVGMMGIQPPTEQILVYATTKNPAELTFALVSDEAQGNSIGTTLVNVLTKHAISEGSTELVVGSSQRYKTAGWPFWRKLFGEPVGIAAGYGGSGGDAMIWRKSLNAPETT